jgi:hypothetical protein
MILDRNNFLSKFFVDDISIHDMKFKFSIIILKKIFFEIS